MTTTPMEPFRRLITKITALADSLGLDVVHSSFSPDMDSDVDILQMAFVVRPETTDQALADNLTFQDIIARFDTDA